MATRWDWDCDSCGFHNSPNANRQGAEKQLKCEQCGHTAPNQLVELAKKEAARA